MTFFLRPGVPVFRCHLHPEKYDFGCDDCSRELREECTAQERLGVARSAFNVCEDERKPLGLDAAPKPR